MNIDDLQQAKAVGQAFADYLDLVDEVVARISDADIRARISRAMAPAAGTASPPHGGVRLVQSRRVSRIADRVVEDSGSLIIQSGDLRTMSDGDRAETQAIVAEWRELVGACPAGAFGAAGSAMVLRTVARLAEIFIADRDEHAALALLQTVSPHLVFLGHRHPAGFAVRRARAEALSELGQYRQAETKLRGLCEDEQRVFGAAHPRTELLLFWVLVGQGRLREADGGFRSLEDRLIRSPGSDTLLHTQCRRSWLLGRLGLVDESVSDYARVIVSRTNELGGDHPDTLDARHSQCKIRFEAGLGAQALPFLQALAEDRARVQGDRHPDTLETRKYHHLTQVQAEPRDHRVVERAIHELVEIDRIQRELHGQGHPVRRDTASWLRKLRRGEPISSTGATWNTPSMLEQLARGRK